jgi:hypothetical protein
MEQTFPSDCALNCLNLHNNLLDDVEDKLKYTYKAKLEGTWKP